MTFLSPTLLWGLLALSVPIIVHFFNLQRPREILFSNISFVKEVKKTVVRRLKFKQWLLLLLRLLALSFLVMAFAGPTILKDNKAVNTGGRSVAIVIDNSYSMKAGNERGDYFQQSISLARSMVKAYDKQSEFLIMAGSNPRLNYDFGTLEEGIESLSEIQVEQNDLSLDALFDLREDIFSKAAYLDKELIFFSDFQSSTIMGESIRSEGSDSSLSVKLIPLATRRQKNVYIQDNTIKSRILQKGKPVEMSLSLTNDGEENIKDVNIRVLLEGKAVAISNTDIEKDAQKLLDLTFTPSESGWLSGEIQIDDNPIDFDNKRYFSLYIPEEEKVLVLEDQVSPNLKLLYKDLFDSFESEIYPLRNAATVQFSDYKSIVLVGIRNMTSGFREKLVGFLEEGGSLMLFPGAGMNLQNINAFLTQAGVGSFSELVEVKQGQKGNQAELDHPVFDGIYNDPEGSQEFDAPLIYQYHPINLDNTSIQNRIIQMDNRALVLLESELSKGLIYTFSVFPGDNWTDLHVKSIFAPLMFRLTQIMNQRGNSQQGQVISDFKARSIRTGNNQSLITLEDKEGNIFTPEQYVQGGATTLNFSRIELKEGNYSLKQEGERLEKISFNISDEESKLAYLEENEIRDKLGESSAEVDFLDPKADSIAKKIQQEKEGIPLWKYFILAALLFLLLEIMVLKLRFS